VPEFSYKHLQCFEGHCLPAEDLVGLLDVCKGLPGRETDRSFDSIENETNHFLCCIEVAIPLREFFLRDGLFAIHVLRKRRWGEEGMDAMDCCTSYRRDV